ncbi:hypothetical protein A3F32_01905 [Candidatus Roizmanbacteria bacterium RIFCSPHIGHO2_12_FULL_42_10]|uniref:Uncharacterized protein n=1 Tax=Candidatus Roizmanbacteria bacterium RIFCSPHIGHO2_12_FULL_42_10 TaxID=1802053 RepID=A0A1F7I5Y5_9BACT|nr:MAG: hypothetical protein A3F32_01905 [Candidatus Roizmanbacteria bacterium RIFCSPHIGHO2_12_FULL_42_10]
MPEGGARALARSGGRHGVAASISFLGGWVCQVTVLLKGEKLFPRTGWVGQGKYRAQKILKARPKAKPFDRLRVN